MEAILLSIYVQTKSSTLKKNEYDFIKVIDSQYAIIYHSTGWSNYKLGLLNWKTNEVILQPYYNYISHEFSNNSYLVVENNDKYGVFDIITGKEIIPTNNDSVYIEGDYVFTFCDSKDIKDKLIDLKTSEILLSKDAIFHSENFTSVKDGKKWCIMNPYTGKIFLEKECEFLQPINDTYAYICIDEKEGLIDWKNDKLIFLHEDFFTINGTYVSIKVDDNYGVVNSVTGEILTNFKYDFILGCYGTEYAEVSKNDTYGLINYRTGEEILSPIYDSLRLIDDTYAEVVLDGEKQIINYITQKTVIKLPNDNFFILKQNTEVESTMDSTSGFYFNISFINKFIILLFLHTNYTHLYIPNFLILSDYFDFYVLLNNIKLLTHLYF